MQRWEQMNDQPLVKVWAISFSVPTTPIKHSSILWTVSDPEIRSRAPHILDLLRALSIKAALQKACIDTSIIQEMGMSKVDSEDITRWLTEEFSRLKDSKALTPRGGKKVPAWRLTWTKLLSIISWDSLRGRRHTQVVNRDTCKALLKIQAEMNFKRLEMSMTPRWDWKLPKENSDAKHVTEGHLRQRNMLRINVRLATKRRRKSRRKEIW